MSEIEELSDVQHVISKRAMYADVGDIQTSNFVYMNGNLETQIYMENRTPVHLFKEIVANALDASDEDIEINYNFSQNNQSFEVINYGSYLNAEDLIKCFLRFRTGSNFKSNITGIGRNGYGAKVVVVLCPKTVIWTYNPSETTLNTLKITNPIINQYKRPEDFQTTLKDTKIEHTIKTEKINYGNKSFVKVKYVLSDEFKDCTDYAQYLAQLTGFAIALNRKFTFNIYNNSKLIDTYKFDCNWNIFKDIYGQNPYIQYDNWYLFQDLSLNAPLKTIGFVNGLRCDEGKHIDFVKKAISNTLKGLDTHLNNLVICVNYKGVNVQQSGQSKGKLLELTTPMKEIPPEILEPIKKWAFVKLIHKQNEHKLLSKVRLLSDKDNENYIPPSSKSTKYDYLFIGEGCSVKGYLQEMRKLVGSNSCGIYLLRGKVLNCEAANIEHITQSKIIEGLASALKLKLTDNNIQNCRYQRIVIATDADDDGLHILTLVTAIFTRLWPEIIKNGCLYFLKSPIIKVFDKQNNVIQRIHSNTSSELNFKAVNKYNIVYYKGLGSCEVSDIHDDFYNAPIYQITCSHLETELNYFKRMMKSSVLKKELFKKHTLNISETNQTLSNLKTKPVKCDISLDNLINILYRTYVIRSLIRSIPQSSDGLKDCIRKILHVILTNHTKYSNVKSYLKYMVKSLENIDCKKSPENIEKIIENNVITNYNNRENITRNELISENLTRNGSENTNQNITKDNIKPFSDIVNHSRNTSEKVSKNGFENVKNYIKVDSLANEVSAVTQYHHGSVSLSQAIVRMGQNFNNELCLLNGHGQFGTINGDDVAASRYLKVSVPKYLSSLFPHYNLYKRIEIDGKLAEYECIPCVVPPCLINQTIGIGSGWSVKVLPIDIKELIRYIKDYLKDKENIQPLNFDSEGVTRISNKKFKLEAKTEISNGIITCYKPIRGQTFEYHTNLLKKYEIPYIHDNDKIIVENIKSEQIFNACFKVSFTSNINVMRDDDIIEFDSPEAYLTFYIENNLRNYEKVHENAQKLLISDLNQLKSKYKYIELTHGKRFSSIKELITLLEQNHLDTSIVKLINDFDKTLDNMQKLKNEIDYLESLKIKSPSEIYIQDLENLLENLS